MHAGEPPFNFDTLTKLKDHIIQGLINFPLFFDASTKQIIEGLLKVNPDERLGSNMKFIELKSHGQFNGFNFDKLIIQELEAPWTPTAFEVEDLKWFKNEDINHNNIE